MVDLRCSPCQSNLSRFPEGKGGHMEEGTDYIRLCVFNPSISDDVRRRCTKSKPPPRYFMHEVITTPRPYMENEELLSHLSEYDESGFSNLPKWMRHELSARNLSFGPREPTRYEAKLAEPDAREHRRLYHEETLDDLYEHYVTRGKKK